MSNLELVEDASSRLAHLEAAIERGVAQFVKTGAALEEIREHDLYRPAYPTFEAYCLQRWQFTAARARQLIAAARAVTAGIASDASTEREARERARESRRAESDSEREAMREFLSEHPLKAEPRSADVPEGVRVSHVAPISYQILNDRSALQYFTMRADESKGLNEREYVYLLTALDSAEASIRENLRVARRALREARRRHGDVAPASRCTGVVLSFAGKPGVFEQIAEPSS